MIPQEIRGGLAVEGLEVRVSTAQDAWLVVWERDGVPVGQATFRETEDGLLWDKFWGAERGQGLYTAALRFSQAHGGALIDGRTGEREFYLSAGFKDSDEGLKSDSKRAKAFLKGR